MAYFYYQCGVNVQCQRLTSSTMVKQGKDFHLHHFPLCRMPFTKGNLQPLTPLSGCSGRFSTSSLWKRRSSFCVSASFPHGSTVILLLSPRLHVWSTNKDVQVVPRGSWDTIWGSLPELARYFKSFAVICATWAHYSVVTFSLLCFFKAAQCCEKILLLFLQRLNLIQWI